MLLAQRIEPCVRLGDQSTDLAIFSQRQLEKATP
jgi:hypothetical protein